MSRNKSKNSTYQSLYLWASFLLGMISLGIVVWQRSSGCAISNKAVIPNIVRDLHNVSQQEIPRFTRVDSLSFASSFVLSVLTYQQTRNPLASMVTLFWSSVLGLEVNKRQVIQEFQVNNDSVGMQFQPAVAALNNSTDFMVVWSGDTIEGNVSRSVYGRRFNRGGTPVTDDIVFIAGTNNSLPHPAIASLTDGFVISWRSTNQTGDGWDLLGQIYNSNDSIMGDNLLIMQNSSIYGLGASSIGTNLALKMFIVSWDSYTPDIFLDYDIFARVYSENGTALTNFFQLNNASIGGNQSRRSIKLLSNGCWIINWLDSQLDNSSYGIAARLYTYPDLLGSEFLVNQFTLNSQIVPVAIPFPNEFVIVWKSQGPEINNDTLNYLNNYGVYGRGFYNNGTAIGNEFRVNFHSLAYWDGLTAIAINQDYFVAFWVAYKDRRIDTYDIYGQVCSKLGERIGPEFLVNNANYSLYVSDYGNLATDVLDNNTFVVVWSSLENGDVQIKARIFTLTELGINLLPATSVSTMPVTTSLMTTTLNSVAITTTEITATTNSEPLSSNNNPNIAGYAGGAAAGGVVLGGLFTAGFFICRNKSRLNKADSIAKKKTEVELRDARGAISPNSNYARVDEVKNLEKEYDNPAILEI
jgi:hypothetical protein